PQGAGKTTLTAKLIQNLGDGYQLKAVCFSLDDLYLTFAEQNNLALGNPSNPLLEFRGNPGTHDLSLGVKVFESLFGKTGLTEIPRYEKSLNNGRGDRLPNEKWTRVELPVDVILFEGWCLGFKPVLDVERVKMLTVGSKFGPDFANFSVENMMAVQDRVGELAMLHQYIDCFVHICAKDIGFVYNWRQQQEDSMRVKLGDAKAGLTCSQLRDFISRFMPQYLIGLPRLESQGFFEQPNGCHLKVVIDKDRTVISSEAI
ncbi:hypothetical protein BDR26DRAFT_797195, partial [Obelidium mucronatum]